MVKKVIPIISVDSIGSRPCSASVMFTPKSVLGAPLYWVSSGKATAVNSVV